MKKQTTMIIGAALGALAVILGASGAHAWKSLLESLNKAHTFELANRYHFYHAITLLIIGTRMTDESKLNRWAALLIFLGVLCFSGSLYIMSFFKIPLLGPVTPVGGVLLIGGWLLLLFSFIQNRKASN